MSESFSKTFKIDEYNYNRYKKIFDLESENNKILHKELFSKMLDKYEENINQQHNKNLTNNVEQINTTRFFTNTNDEKNYNERICVILKSEIERSYNEDKGKYKGIKDYCIHLASNILNCAPTNREAIRLGDNIYKASNNKKHSLTISNLIELETKCGLKISDSLKVQVVPLFPAIESLNSVYEYIIAQNPGWKTHKLSRFLNSLSDVLMKTDKEAQLEDIIDELNKSLKKKS